MIFWQKQYKCNCMLIFSFYYYINFPSFQMPISKLSILTVCAFRNGAFRLPVWPPLACAFKSKSPCPSTRCLLHHPSHLPHNPCEGEATLSSPITIQLLHCHSQAFQDHLQGHCLLLSVPCQCFSHTSVLCPIHLSGHNANQ